MKAPNVVKTEQNFQSDSDGVRPNALDFAAAHHSQAIARSELSHNVPHVIFDSLLRDVQLSCDLFVCKVLAKLFDDLLFPPAETELRTPCNLTAVIKITCQIGHK